MRALYIHRKYYYGVGSAAHLLARMPGLVCIPWSIHPSSIIDIPRQTSWRADVREAACWSGCTSRKWVASSNSGETTGTIKKKDEF